MRIGIIGYGSVAAIHADALSTMPTTELAVWGPDGSRAAAFAARVAGGPGCSPAESLPALIESSDAIVIASPSPLHEAQAEIVLSAGRAALIELPACGSGAGGERLARLASDRGALVRGVHTSRFLAPYAFIGAAIHAGRVGRIERLMYERTVVLKPRSWADDALRHHAAHPIDLFNDWLGGPAPTSCETWWRDGSRVGMTADLTFDSGATAAIAVRYADAGARSVMRVEGSRGSLETDGFTWVAQDGAAARELWDGQTSYAASIERCDALFLDALGGRPVGPTWAETIGVARVVDALEAIERRHDA